MQAEAGDILLCYCKCFMSVLYCEAECPVARGGHGDALPLGETTDRSLFARLYS